MPAHDRKSKPGPAHHRGHGGFSPGLRSRTPFPIGDPAPFFDAPACSLPPPPQRFRSIAVVTA